MTAEVMAGDLTDPDMMVGETMDGDMEIMMIIGVVMIDIGIEMTDTVDAIGMNAIERMRIVRNLPLNMGHKDSTSFTTEMCVTFSSLNNPHDALS